MGSDIAAPEIATSGLPRPSRQQWRGRRRPTVGRAIAGLSAQLDRNERHTCNDNARNGMIADKAQQRERADCCQRLPGSKDCAP